MEDTGGGGSENKENVSRKRSLSETNSAAEGTVSGSEGHPMAKKVKVVDIVLDSNEADLTIVKKEPFVDGMCCVCVCVCVCVRVCARVRGYVCACAHVHARMHAYT